VLRQLFDTKQRLRRNDAPHAAASSRRSAK
jgi:hypothetical protein